MNEKYNIEQVTDSYEVIQLLEDRIYGHNSTSIGKNNGCLFSRIVRDENNNIIAGIAGWTWAKACEITQFWVDEKARGKGIGKILLEAAEAEAKSKECSIILVKSYSFQAPHFYEKRGYRIEHMLEDFPQGCSYYTLVKRIE